MTDRNKVLVGASIVWGITVCCFIITRKLRASIPFFNFLPGILFGNEKMEPEDNQKCEDNEPGTSMNNSNSLSQIVHEDDIAKRTQNFMFGGLTGASPPKFVSLEEILRATHGITNMALAHEIALDKNFQLQKLESNDTLHSKVKENMHKAFWDLLAVQLAEDPPDYTQALKLLEEIKETLDVLVLPHHTKIKENIKEVLDIDLIKQQAEKGVLDFHHYAEYIINIMSKICAPVRDEKIKELRKCTDVIETFKGIMETLQLMRLDLANFTISMMRPNIVASSIEYEKAKFAEFLKVQTDGLQYTRQWLLRHLDSEKILQCSSDPNSIQQITHVLLSEAYLDILEWDFDINAETLILDQGRLLELRDRINRLSVIGSIILLVNNTIGASIQGVSSFKNDLKQHLNILLESVHSNKDLEIVMPSVVIQVKKDITTTLENIGAFPMTKELEGILEGQILDISNPSHKIRHLVSLRIKQFLQKIIMSQSAAPQQIPPGLSSLQDELAAIAAQFLILVAHNRSVFKDYYQDIVSNAIRESGGSSKAVDIQS